MHKIKKDDLVKVIAGKDKDKQGKVLLYKAKNNKFWLKAVNMITKHVKPGLANHRRYRSERSSDRYFQRNVCCSWKSNQSRLQSKDGKKSVLPKQPAKYD